MVVLFHVSSIINPSSRVLSMISSAMTSVCCWVTNVVPGFLNLTSMYLIRLSRVRYYSIRCILRIYMAAGTFTASLRTLARLVRYLIIRASD